MSRQTMSLDHRHGKSTATSEAPPKPRRNPCVVVVQEADVRGVTLCSLMLAAMASSTRRASHDYTEGAAPEDIEQALLNSRRSRRASQLRRLWRRRVRIRFRWSWTCWDTKQRLTDVQHEGRRRSSESWSRSRRMSRIVRTEMVSFWQAVVHRTDSGELHSSYDQ